VSGLRGRIIRLERNVPIGIEARLRALTDEELVARIAELFGFPVVEVRAWTPDELRRLQDKMRAAMTEG